MTVLWNVRLSKRAAQDYVEAIRWSHQRFGKGQAQIYAQVLTKAVDALREGPELGDVRTRDDIGPGIKMLHVGRQGQRGRHFIVFRLSSTNTIDIVRILHDSMDFSAHVS